MSARLIRINNTGSAFILMEVMLATGIFAMVALGLAVALNRAIEASILARRESSIAWNMESQLNEARTGQIVIGKDTSKPDSLGVVYVKEITRLDLKAKNNQPLNGLYNIKITARWNQDNEPEEMYAQTYVYVP